MLKNISKMPMHGDGDQSPTLTISVVSHGHAEMLAALLDDVVQWRKPNSAIVVTFNIPEKGGFDRTRWSGIEWIDNPVPKGFAANHNAALLGRSSRWYAVVNPDIRIGSDVFGALIDRAQNDAAAGLIAPGVIGPDGTLQDSARKLLTPARLVTRIGRKLAIRGPSQEPIIRQELDWIAGMFLIIRGNAFEAINGFDERFFLYCEDMDICVRLQLAGYRIEYERNIEVIHDARRSSHRSATHLRWHVASILRAWFSQSFWDYWRNRQTH